MPAVLPGPVTTMSDDGPAACSALVSIEVPGAAGLRRIVVDSGHLAVWILLGGAFGIAAVRGEWNRASGVLAAGAGATYAVFLGAVFLGRA